VIGNPSSYQGAVVGTENPWISRNVFQTEAKKILSRRAVNGLDEDKVKENLVGLALSGGGIRSATFGLGVLEGLKLCGLLKKIDYLSTVSGGGYIGAWLGANCKRAAVRKAKLKFFEDASKCPASRESFEQDEEACIWKKNKDAYKKASVDWLDEHADWSESISHLRRYSNYLSPQIGFFSADTWSMATIWFRNTLLVQLTVILAIAVLLLLPRLLFPIFQEWPYVGNWRWTTVVLFILAVAGIAGNQWRLNSDRDVPFLGGKSWAMGLIAALTFLGAAAILTILSGFHPFTDDPTDWIVAPTAAFLLVLAGFCLLPVAVKVVSTFWWGGDPPKQINYTQGWVQTGVVLPMMVAGCLVAAILWGQTVGLSASGELSRLDTFGGFLTNAWRYWPFPLSIAFVSFWLLSFFSRRKNSMGLIAALLAPVTAVLLLYVLLCTIMLLMHEWNQDPNAGIWLAFVWGPALVMYAFSLAIVMLIGIMGRQSIEGIREWWSRLGAWLGIYGFSWMMIAVVAVYGPKWSAMLLDSDTWKGISITGWLTTSLAGLLAGKSNSTNGIRNSAKSEKTTAEKILNLVAMVGPFVFIAGLLIGISTCLHLLILSISSLDWDWHNLHAMHQHHWEFMSDPQMWKVAFLVMVTAIGGALLLAARVDINVFSLNAFYRSRLSRCYLGASRFLQGERTPQNFTGFDEKDDLPMADLGGKGDDEGKANASPVGPLHIINCALNLGGSSDLALHTRHSASFVLTPYVAGSDYLSKEPSGERQPLGYQPIVDYGGPDGQPTLAQAISVSGAAASPNMGYHTSPVVAFLLTIFNVRLGWWFPNPKKSGIQSPSPWFSLRYLIKELFGGADDKSNYLMISDGGHFENLAAYELIRRRCRVIIISDAECDRRMTFGGLGSLIRMCEVDFGVTISIDVDAIRLDPVSDWSKRQFAIGEIHYGDGIPKGVLIYLKASMTGCENTAVLQYKSGHLYFPHEATGDQFYGEDQFESYRHLGKETAVSIFGSVDRELDFVTTASDLQQKFSPHLNILLA
jgi:hypothetical protein